MSKARVSVIIGAQWGDEGKGKWVDILAEKADIVVRFQGGNNAGHTLYKDGQKIVLHQIPSGALRQQTCMLGAGVVVNPTQLISEIETLNEFGVDLSQSQLWLSARAHVITPWTIFQDCQREQKSTSPIGTTKRGIGPTYADKAHRIGLRLGDYANTESRHAWIEKMKAEAFGFSDFYQHARDDWREFDLVAEKIAAYVCDAEAKLRHAIKDGKNILLEGAQGSLLDIDHGTYPFVTSSHTILGGACASLGLGAKVIDQVWGVSKAYATRVGEGPMTTELFDEVGAYLADRGKEKGATTGRPRRCGWLDLVALRYAIDVNGFDSIILNKMDVLNDLDVIKVAVAYKHPQLGEIREMPWDPNVIAKCEPVYQSFKGWKCDLPESGKIADLPQAAKDYIIGISELCKIPIEMVGTGVNRHNALYK